MIDYAVDGGGRRIAKKVNGAPTQRFLYGRGLLPVAELDAFGNAVATFVYATKAHSPDYMTKGGATYRIVSDHLGSPRLVVNAATGEVAQRLDYDAFGKVTQDTNPGFQPFGFSGGLYDPATGLVRFGLRDYDAETGRWTAKDPIGFEGGDANLYSYVGNDPVNYVDPTDEIAFLALVPIVWGAREVGLSVADAISTASTLMDGCASGAEKAMSAGLFAAGMVLPGGGGSTAAKGATKAVKASKAPRMADDLVDLSSPARRTHILDGEVRPNGTFGGGHRAGTGFPGKTEFPAEWSDDLIMHHISDIATDPASQIVRQQGRDVFLRAVRDGQEIEVLLRNGEIWTAYPVRR